MHVLCIFVSAPVQCNSACFTWKGALEIRSLSLLLSLPVFPLTESVSCALLPKVSVHSLCCLFQIEFIDEIQPEQLLCVSSGKPFIKPQSLRTTVEVRANWGRARKQYGPQATDIGVSIEKNPKVNVSILLVVFSAFNVKYIKGSQPEWCTSSMI